ncbi:PqiB family protein [Meridianimarinicoccus aquatilis]|uniref:MCE family protein n=1 Tax=Meridianimarinicoccus aquatilis TaxID=2552766 RepID=A0A4R6AVL5_9RHOB|nr:MlaD family protein [Fluviibacterium aquatile]TDL88167.1 MCE family protein [Fluviibacterium aquatile]
MTDQDTNTSSPKASEPDLVTRRGGISGTSLIWIVPLVALMVALAMAWQSLSDRGPLIEVTFQNADGVVANETQLKFRDVTVGKVESIRFADDLRNVSVSIRVDKDIARFIDADARFWIVQPEISSQGISGLGTLLGGVYLEGTWDNIPGSDKSEFVGLDYRPLIKGTEKGVEFVLSAPRGGSISAGAPIIYKGVNVGLIERPILADDGGAVTARAFVRAPYDRLVTTGSQFWGASGVSVSFGPTGLKVDVANLSALIQGGIAFDTINADGQPIVEGHVFPVYASRDAAGSSNATLEEGPRVPFSALFSDSIEGLTVGSTVEYRGLRVGTVAGTGGQIAPDGAAEGLLLRADLNILPARLGLDGEDVAGQTRALMERLVAEGYRLQLVSEGLLGASLKVLIVKLDDPAQAQVTTDALDRVMLPTAPPDISNPANTARNAIARLNGLPVESIVDSIGELLNNVNQVIASEGARAAPEAILGLVEDIRGVVGSPSVQGAADSASESLESLNAILTRVQQGEAIENVLSALERSDAIAASLQTTIEGLPDLTNRFGALAAEAASLPLEQLLGEAQNLVAAATGIVQSDATQQLPELLASALAEVQTGVENLSEITTRVNSSDALPNLLTALQRTTEITTDIQTSAAAFPDLVDELTLLVNTANEVPLGALAARADALLAGLQDVVTDPATKSLPAQIGTTLDGLGAAVDQVRDVTNEVLQSGAVDSLTAALKRADSIAQSVDTAAAGLPDLLARIDAVAREAETLPLGELVKSANDLVVTAEQLVGSEDTAQIPAALASALDELGATLEELRQGGVVENANAALASASDAADAIAAAAANLPDLSRRLEGLVAQSELLLATYGGRSEFNAQTLAALRDLRDSARAVTSLARTIERKPNSLLIGR